MSRLHKISSSINNRISGGKEKKRSIKANYPWNRVTIQRLIFFALREISLNRMTGRGDEKERERIVTGEPLLGVSRRQTINSINLTSTCRALSLSLSLTSTIAGYRLNVRWPNAALINNLYLLQPAKAGVPSSTVKSRTLVPPHGAVSRPDPINV